MMKRFLVLILLAASALAYGDIYKSVDEHGNVTYSSTPSKGAKKVDLPPITVVPSPAPAPAETPEKVAPTDDAAQKATKRKQLEDELAKEQVALEQAKKALKEAEDHPHVFVKPGGGIGRNVAAYDEAVRKAKEEVAQHEANIANIQAQLAKLN